MDSKRQLLVFGAATIVAAAAVSCVPVTTRSLGSRQPDTDSAAVEGPSLRAAEARLWVVQPPGELVALTSELARVGAVKLPAFAVKDPTCISVNQRGQILARATGDSLWIWDGAGWRARSRQPSHHYLAPTDSTHGSCSRAWFLGASGNSLFMLETSSVVWAGESETDSAYNAARMEETDLDLLPRAVVFDSPYARCEDNPSQVEAYTEPCSEARVEASRGVVGDFFVLNGQHALKARSEGSTAAAQDYQSLFVREPRGWRVDGLALNGDGFFDHGRTQIGSGLDMACCGWSNENSNTSWIVREGVTTVFFDEWARYRNQDYDVSFFTENPTPSPDRRGVGFTIRANGELRESADGQADTLELARVNAGLADLPVAEVVVLDPKPSTLWRMAHAEFAGWLDRNHVLIEDHGNLAVIDVSTGKRRDTGVAVRGLNDVIVVAP